MYFTNELKIYLLSILITIRYALGIADPNVVQEECKMTESSIRPYSVGQVKGSNPEGNTRFFLCLS